MRSPRRWHTQNGYHPSPQQRYFVAQKPKKRAKVQLFFDITKIFSEKNVKSCFFGVIFVLVLKNQNNTVMVRIVFQDKEILAIENENVVGKLEYALLGEEMHILHTYAYVSGQGIGSQLMRAATQWAAAHNVTIVPICSFAQKYLSAKSSKI